MKKIKGTYVAFVFAIIVSLLYYTWMFYYKGRLLFEKDMLIPVMIFVFLVILILIVGVINLFMNVKIRESQDKTERQNEELVESNKRLTASNEELKSMLESLIDNSKENHDEVLLTLQNSRILEMKLLNKKGEE